MSRSMTSRRNLHRRLLAGAATMIVAVGALSACSGAPAALQATTAASLQSSVLDISTASAGGDFETAVTLLQAVEAELRTAAAAGQVTPERSAEIQSAISAVNSGLLSAIADAEPEPAPVVTSTPTPAPTVTVTPSPTPIPTSDDNDDSANDEEQPSNGDTTGNDNSGNSDNPGNADSGNTDSGNTDSGNSGSSDTDKSDKADEEDKEDKAKDKDCGDDCGD